MGAKVSFLSGSTFILSVIIVSFYLSSCKKEAVDIFDCAGLTPTYTADIKPILDVSCAKSGCHNAATAKKGVNLSNYASASAVSQEARFLGAIQHKQGYAKMPDDGPKLADSKIELLTCWVQAGSPQ